MGNVLLPKVKIIIFRYYAGVRSSVAFAINIVILEIEFQFEFVSSY